MPDSSLSNDTVIVSNRGPISFRFADDGTLLPRRGAGGLISGIGPLVADTSAIWVAAAMSEADRQATNGGVTEAEGFRISTLALDDSDFRLAYDVVCNTTLWFLYHGLFELAREPNFDRDWWAAWDAYRRVNDRFAESVAKLAPADATILVQDYHLALVGPRLSELRPDLATSHFSHTPFASPKMFNVLPEAVRRELLEGMAGHGACGFHTHRWADDFGVCCDETLGRRPKVFVSPLAPDPDDINGVARGEACAQEFAALDQRLAGRRLITRVDRIELSKNLLRGFQAFDELLHDQPSHRGEVVFGAFGYPSREALPAYVRYAEAVDQQVAAINERWGTIDWTPIIYDTSDNFPASIAALRRADVLLVNPIRDGLNLVAKEGALVNERDAPLVLSTEAGAAEELADFALMVNPFDVRATAEQLHRALSLDPGKRQHQAQALREAAGARTPADWLTDQLAAAEPPDRF